MSTMTRKEWVAACADRIERNTGCSRLMARLGAGTLADEQTVKHGASGSAWTPPVDAADAANADDYGGAN